MDQIEAIIKELYANNQSKLRQMCHKEMSHFGGITKKDYDDFYSRVGYEIALVTKPDKEGNTKYDPSCGKTFIEYISGVIRQSIWKEMSYRNRGKRQTIIEKEEVDENGNIKKIRKYVSNVSIDAPISDDGLTIGDTLKSDFNMEDALANNGEFEDENVGIYLNSLSKIQRRIVEMKMDGISVMEIKDRLHLTDKQYNQHCNELKSFANISILYGKKNEKYFEEDDLEMSTTTQTMENCKTDKISIASIIKRIERHTIRFDHPLQRESDQWSPSMKGNLISDILQGNKLHPLIFAEQIINGVPIIWDLDGKQRCTNAYSFAKNGYKISKNIRRWLIKYQTTEKDENGKDILDENGFPIAVNDEFDIRGKKFSDLPEELQDRFLDYNFNYDQYLNCSEEDIGYHIERYNDGKNMNTAQKGTVKLGTEYAEMVKSISAMPFFRDIGGYKVSEFKNGTINRVVVESVMAANFVEDWKKKQEDMCEYIKNNATSTEFDNFEDMIGRLEKVVTEDVADMFDSKDSFLWFGLFAKFIKMEDSEDKRFIEFMAEFHQSLHSKKIKEISFDDLNGKSTKDKNVVVGKMRHLEKLMCEFLHIKEEDIRYTDCTQFIKENIEDVTDEDIELFGMIANDVSESVDIDSWIISDKNRPSYLAIVGHAIRKDNDRLLNEWLPIYEKNNTFELNQKQAFLHMKDSFDKFVQERNVA